jgi:hypothetical protein
LEDLHGFYIKINYFFLKKLVLAVAGILLELLLHLLLHLRYVVVVLGDMDKVVALPHRPQDGVVSSIGWALENDLTYIR